MTAWTNTDYDDVTEIWYRKMMHYAGPAPSPLLEDLLANAKGDWTGAAQMQINVKIGNPQGVGSNIARAQARNSPHRFAKFMLTPAYKYGEATLDGKTLLFVKDDKSRINAVKEAMADTRETMLEDVARDLYGAGYGTIGKIATGGITGNVITLTNPDDAINFSIGMGVVADDNETGASLRAGSTTVTEVNTLTGKITLASVAGITSLTAADYLFRDGDENQALTGLCSKYDSTSKKGWLPNTYPVSGDGETHFGETRSQHIPRLTGHSIDGTNAPVEEALIEAGGIASRVRGGKEIGDIYINNMTFAQRMKRALQKVVLSNADDTVKIGFTGMRLALPSGIAKVHIDPYCPRGRIFGLRKSHWWLQYAGEDFIHFADPKGSNWHMKEGSDEFINRFRGAWQLACDNPAPNFNLQIDEE